MKFLLCLVLSVVGIYSATPGSIIVRVDTTTTNNIATNTIVIAGTNAAVRGLVSANGGVFTNTLTLNGIAVSTNASSSSVFVNGTSISAPNITNSATALVTVSAVTNILVNPTNIANAQISATAAIDATKIADGSVTSGEFQFIGGLTSDAQVQLGTKAATATTISAGAGLSGGGSLAANRTLTLDGTTFVNNFTMWDSSQATRTWTIGLSGATDPVWTYGNNSADLTAGVLKYGGNTVATLTAGVLPASMFPTLTGDITTAGGALATTLANTAVTPTTYGDSTHVGQFTVDSKGRITAASAVAISGGGGGDNWVAAGTTNSTLPGTGAVYNLVVTNQSTFGNGTTPALWTFAVGGNITNAGTGVFLTNDIPFLFNSNVIFATSITNSSLTASTILVADSTKKIVSGTVGTGLSLSSGTLSSTILGATLGSMINSGASIATAIPEYADITGTNIVPSKLTVISLTNLAVGALTVTNFATMDNVVVTNGSVVGSLTNNGLTASRLTGTDSTKKLISIAVGDGLTNSANTLSWAVAAGSGITLATNAGQVTITASSGGGGTVTATGGSLTANAVILGAGSTDTKVSSSITTDGSAKLTLGTLDVGNNTDTTISRPSAGDISVEGNIVYRAGGTDVAVADGGTGLSSGTSGGILGYTASGTLASSAALTANALVIGGGAGATPTTTTTGTGVLTALGNAVNTSGGVITSAGTVSSATAGGGNTIVSRKTLALQFTHVALTSMIVNSNDFSLASYGRVRFPGNSALTNANYAIFRSVVPIKFVGGSGQDLTMEKLTFKTTGTQTGAVTFNIGVVDVADSATADPTDATSFGSYVALTSATLSSPVANDRFSISNKTLTGWRTALTAGDDMAVCLVRNDTNTDGVDQIDLVISYVESQ